MIRTRHLSLFAALAAVATVHGQTSVVSARIDYTTTNWGKSLVLPQFNVPGARLDSVDVAFHGAVRGTLLMENRNPIARPYSGTFSYGLALSKPDGTPLLTLTPATNSVSGTLAAYDGALDHAGASGTTYDDSNGLKGDASGTATLTGADLAAFVGDGSVSLSVDASASSDVRASGNFDVVATNQSAADITLTYHYTNFAKLGSLGDRLWFDTNANGVQDPNEKGLVGVGVKLLDAAGKVLKTTSTGENGNYLFDDLPEGDYRVQFDRPAGYGFVTRDAGTNDDLDSDADGAGLAGPVHLDAGQNRLDVDAGVAGGLCLGDRVWKDLNGNGLQDCNEPGVGGVGVHLLDDSGNGIADTVTDANGLYRFANVATGDYTVDFDAPTGMGFTKPFADSRYKSYDSNADAEGGEASVHLTHSDLTIDAGLVGALKIGDTVWLDGDGDGKFDVDGGERGLKGVDVYLWGDLNNDGRADVYLHTKTDSNGHYLFNSLYPGVYLVATDANDLRGLKPTYDLDGAGSANVAVARLRPGVDNLDFDFGYKPVGCGGGASHCWWQCNPGCWPHGSLWIGGKCHSKPTVCNWMKVGDCADRSIALYQRLCAAKLNVGAGCDGGTVLTCGKLTLSVKDAIRKADAWMAAHPVGCRVLSGSADWASIADCFGILDKFCGK